MTIMLRFVLNNKNNNECNIVNNKPLYYLTIKYCSFINYYNLTIKFSITNSNIF